MQFWLKSASQQALNSLHCLFVAFDLSLAMKLLLTPVGPSDNIVKWIPRHYGFIPEKAHVRVCVCNDGKRSDFKLPVKQSAVAEGRHGEQELSWTAQHAAFDASYYQRLFEKMCKASNAVVKTVSLQEISFFDDEDTAFYEKLKDCDVFFMAGQQRWRTLKLSSVGEIRG